MKHKRILFTFLLVSNLICSPALAAENPAGVTIPGLAPSSVSDAILSNYGTILGGAVHPFAPLLTLGMAGNTANTSYHFTNQASGIIDINSSTEMPFGMWALSNGNHVLSNLGSMSITSTSLNPATGMLAQVPTSATSNANFLLQNSGTLTVHAPLNTAIGMAADMQPGIGISMSGNHTIMNSGIMNISGLNAIGMIATTTSFDPATPATGSHTFSNSGIMNVTGVNKAAGMEVNSNIGSHALSNSSVMNINAINNTSGDNTIAESTGMQANVQNGNASITNTGTVNTNTIASINGNDSFLTADSLRIWGLNTSHFVNNHGIINTIATASGNGNVSIVQAAGIAAFSFNSGDVYINNTNTINTIASNYIVGNNNNAAAIGIASATESGTNIIENTGTINTTAISSYGESVAAGIVASSYGNTEVKNAGIIDVSAYGPNSLAVGIAVNSGYGFNTIHRVNNFGQIRTHASQGRAYEVYGINYHVGTFATTLRNWTPHDTVFGTDNTSATVGGFDGQVYFDNSVLILRPGNNRQGFQLGQNYALVNMIAIDQDPEAITYAMAHPTSINGSLGGVTSEVPFLQAHVEGPSHSPQVSLDFNEDELPGSAGLQYALNQALKQYGNVARFVKNQAIESSASEEMGNKWQVFVSPYINTTNSNEYEFNSNSYGVSGGATFRANEKFAIGAHFDFNYGDYFGQIMDMEGDSTSFALGLHATFNIMPEWYITAQLSTAFSQNFGYYDAAALIDLGDVDTQTNGESIFAAINTGYVFKLAEGHTLTPELGFSYIGLRNGGFDLNWKSEDSSLYDRNYDLDYDDSYFTALYGNLSVNWRSEWQFQNDSSLALLASVGVRQKLAGSGLQTHISMGDSSSTFYETEDWTTWLVDAGVEYSIGNFSVSLAYDGQYGMQQESHGGNLFFTFEF